MTKMDSISLSSTFPLVFPQSLQYQERFMKTVLQRHCAFFDRDGDGILSLTDTIGGFRALGFNWIVAIAATWFIHLTCFYQTSPTWIPSPWLPIYLDRIERCRHGSSTKAYEFLGNVVSYPACQNVFAKFESEPRGALNYRDLLQMVWNLRDSFDPFSLSMTLFWWTVLFLLAANHQGLLTIDVMMAQYDGSLFYVLEKQRKIDPKKTE